MRRRRLLAATGTALTTAVAGCGGIFGDNQETAPNSPDGAAEAYVRAIIAGDTRRTRELIHPEAISGLSADNDGGNLTSLDVEVVDENLQSSEVSEYRDAGIVVDLVQVERAALVRVPFEATVDGEQVESTYLIVAAKEDDGWLVLDRGVPTTQQ
jgi:hypothetical protein